MWDLQAYSLASMCYIPGYSKSTEVWEYIDPETCEETSDRILEGLNIKLQMRY